MKSLSLFLLLILFFSINANALINTGTFTPIAPANTVPVQSNHLIWDGLLEKTLNASNVNVSSESINFTIADIDAHSMDWYLYHNDSGVWKLIDYSTGVSNGTEIATNVSWFRQLTNYSVSFNVTDGIGWTNESYWFVTDFSVPQLSNESPANGSVIATSSCSWHINISDYVSFNWTINCSNGQNSSDNESTNGTFYLNLTGLTTASYTVWVNVTNGNMTNDSFSIFTVIIPSEETSVGGGGGGWIPPPEEEVEEEVEARVDDTAMITTGLITAVLFSIFFLIIFKNRKKEKEKA